MTKCFNLLTVDEYFNVAMSFEAFTKEFHTITCECCRCRRCRACYLNEGERFVVYPGLVRIGCLGDVGDRPTRRCAGRIIEDFLDRVGRVISLICPFPSDCSDQLSRRVLWNKDACRVAWRLNNRLASVGDVDDFRGQIFPFTAIAGSEQFCDGEPSFVLNRIESVHRVGHGRRDFVDGVVLCDKRWQRNHAAEGKKN